MFYSWPNLVFINDAPVNINSFTALHVDDKTLINLKIPLKWLTRLQESVQEYTSWFNAYKLKLNVDETHPITFAVKSKTQCVKLLGSYNIICR